MEPVEPAEPLELAVPVELAEPAEIGSERLTKHWNTVVTNGIWINVQKTSNISIALSEY